MSRARLSLAAKLNSLWSVLVALVHRFSFRTQQAAGKVLGFGLSLRREIRFGIDAWTLARASCSSSGRFGDVAAKSWCTFETAAGEAFADLHLAATQTLQEIL